MLGDSQAILNGISDLEVMEIGGQTYLYVASQSGSGMTAYALGAAATPTWIETVDQGETWGYEGQSGALAMTEIAGQRVVFPLGGFHNHLDLQRIEGDGSFGPAWRVPGDTTMLGYLREGLFVEMEGQQFFYGAQIGQSGLEMFEFHDYLEFTHLGTEQDSAAAHVTAVQDLGSVTIAGRSYLLVADGAEHGVTSWRIGDDGTLELVDALDPGAGLWVNTPTCMITVNAGPEAYVVLGAAGSSSLSVLRITPWGSLTPVDQVHDSLHSRFQGVAALEHIEVNGRHFILAGGADDGISLLELGMDGTLHHLFALADQNDTTLTNVTSIRAVVVGNAIQIFVGGAEDGVTMFEIDLTNMGQGISGGYLGDDLWGSWGDDFIAGMEGNDTITSLHGDDILVDGEGSDYLWGGWGADTYVMVDDDTEDTIHGFQFAYDRIDMTDYPLLYDISRLTFAQEGNNVRISYAGDTLVVEGVGMGLITPEMFTEDHFIFY